MTAEQVSAGSGTPQALDVSEIPFEGGSQFNSRSVVVVDTNSGKLFRIELGSDLSSIRAIDEISGATVPGGDGLLLDQGRLVVVQGSPAQLSFLKLRADARQATLQGTQTSDKLPRPVDR